MLRYLVLALGLFSIMSMTPGSAAAEGYPMMCHAGPPMSARTSVAGGFSLTVNFKRASHGFSEQDPPRGTCSWSDRPTNSAEPTHLHFGDPVLTPFVLRQLRSGGYFTVPAFTQGDALEVVSVDEAGGNEGDGSGQLPSEAEQLPSQAEQMPSTEPAPQADVDFSGQWDSQTEDGNEFTIELEQNGKIVNGTYDGVDNDVHGTIKGVIKSGALHFSWTQRTFKGSGVFTLSADGHSFEGSFRSNSQASEKAWSGNRL